MAVRAGFEARQRRVRAYAKINLFLRVLGKRPDGFHDIRTLYQTVSLSDELRVRVTPSEACEVKLECNRADLAGEHNLAWRAAGLMLARTGTAARVELDLVKAIPTGAGLGGGSSDAAAVIRALASMLEEQPDPGLLFEIAAELGSDVPFFLVGGSVLGCGRGTELEPLDDLPPADLVIAQPDVEVSTAWAYGALAESPAELTGIADRGKLGGLDSSSSVPPPGMLPGSRDGMVNDFEPAVFRRHPSIGAVKERLQALGAQAALMSGSGSAVFGIFESRPSATEAAGALRAEGYAAWPAEHVGRAASGMPGATSC